MRFLRPFEGIPGMLESLPGKFVGRQMIPFAMLGGSGTVGVRGHFVKFRGSLMRILRH